MTERMDPPVDAPATGTPREVQGSDAEARVAAAIDQLHRTILSGLEGLRNDSHTRALAPLRQVILDAALAHDRLSSDLLRGETATTTAGSDAAEAAAGDPERWNRLLSYRRGVVERVITPIRARLEGPALREAFGPALQSLMDSFAGLGEGFAAAERLPDETALYQSVSSDGLIRRARKAGVRMRRGVDRTAHQLTNGLHKLRRRPAAPGRVRQRNVALRALVDYHLAVRVPRLVEASTGAQQQQVALTIGRLEEALTSWANDTVDAEQELDRAQWHRPKWLSDWGVPAQSPERAASTRKTVVPDLESIAKNMKVALAAAAGLIDSWPALDTGPATAAAQELALDVRVAGTFMLDRDHRRVPTSKDTPLTRFRIRNDRWARWYDQVLGRFELNGEYLNLRERVLQFEDQLLERVARESLEPVFSSVRGLVASLKGVHEQTKAACALPANRESARALVQTLRTLQAEATERLQDTFRQRPGVASSEGVLSDPAQPEWQACVELMQQLPGAIAVHPWRLGTQAKFDPAGKTLNVDLKQIAQQTIAPPWPEQLKMPAEPLRLAVFQVWRNAEQVLDIIRYSIGSSIEELEAALSPTQDSKTATQGEDPLTATFQTARELAPEAMRRATDSLGEVARTLHDPWFAFSGAVFEAFHDDWRDFHRQVESEEVLEERLVGLRTGATRRVEQIGRRLRERLIHETAELRRRSAILQRRGRDLLKWGRSAVGVAEAGKGEPLGALETIAKADEFRAALPLVYRRLFSFDPVTDAELLEGRARDLVRIRRHFESWRDDNSPGVLILAAPLGSGRTSFLNVVRAKALEKCTTKTLDLSERVGSTEQLAGLIAQALGISGALATSLEKLEAHVLGMPRSQPPLVCVIDNLEHLILQAPGGTDLFERALVFFSRTDTNVYWVGAIAKQAWDFVQKTAAGAAGIVTTHALDSLERRQLEDVIANRHGRTGMPLRFANPPNLSPLMRRRLRRAKSEEHRQKMLRADYFDDLHRLSGEHIMLALFHWVRSTDFSATEDVLTIKPIQSLSFRFLGTFDLPRTFTLKAFIVHNTLSIAEHMQLFRMPEDESTYILEALLNMRLIEPAAPHKDSGGHPRITPGERYRLNRLALYPVIEHLRGRNVVH